MLAQFSTPPPPDLIWTGKDAKVSMNLPDATNVDIYRGASCCIFMINITKKWTFDYVVRMAPEVPDEIPILILVWN